MPPLGAHMSIAGGYYRAVEIARECGCDCVQLFTKNNNQWQGKPLTQDDVDRFRAALESLHIEYPIAHDSYLINLASPQEDLWERSIAAFQIELERAERLGLAYVVAHPGAFTTSTEAEGLARVAAGLDRVHQSLPRVRVKCLLEITAGQGSNLGWQFEHLAHILHRVRHADRLGVCFDTCHAFAAGYELRTPRAYRQTMDQFDRLIGLERIGAFHLNDSVKGLGSRVDRHARIGGGAIGTEAFRLLLNDRRFRETPMYLETPKGQSDGEELDIINLRVLRELMRGAGRKSAAPAQATRKTSTAKKPAATPRSRKRPAPGKPAR